MTGQPRARWLAFAWACGVGVLAWLLHGCASLPSGEGRLALARQLAEGQGWQSRPVSTTALVLQVWEPEELSQVDTLTVYIEGDGLSWLDLEQPSDDPTPLDPIALQLALRDPGRHAVYLARPCQYMSEVQRAQACTSDDWLAARFSARLLRSMSEGLDALKLRHAARQFILIGYSGGATMAALLAAQRHDVSRLITVAGNLDHRAWSAHHRLTPLIGSLNPADDMPSLASVPQVHLVGERDRNTTPDLIRALTMAMPRGASASVVLVPEFDHHCCWVAQWPELLSKAMRRPSHGA